MSDALFPPSASIITPPYKLIEPAANAHKRKVSTKPPVSLVTVVTLALIVVPSILIAPQPMRKINDPTATTPVRAHPETGTDSPSPKELTNVPTINPVTIPITIPIVMLT
ncbi:MAG: hypothetical protein HZC38_19665 [Chloroflexi bacterium]|nr:hypothetical protein [Chloroflexota bacterium]